MKIIFLDIDGVLVSHQSIKEHNETYGRTRFSTAPSRKSIEILNKVIEETGAKIVISSTWRIGNSTHLLDLYFHELGLKGEIIGQTARLQGTRGLEIKTWLLENESIIHNRSTVKLWNQDYRSEVESFVIIDDDRGMDDLMDHLVLTNYDTGITIEDAEKAINILNKE
jgi:hypothetical protein